MKKLSERIKTILLSTWARYGLTLGRVPNADTHSLLVLCNEVACLEAKNAKLLEACVSALEMFDVITTHDYEREMMVTGKLMNAIQKEIEHGLAE